MRARWKQGWILTKTGLNLLFLNMLLPGTASFDIQDHCSRVIMTSCPVVTLESGGTIKYTPKAVPPDLDWLLVKILEDARHYYCTKPACLSNPCLHGGKCEESETGFNCFCTDGYHGERCEYDAFIQSLKLLGGNQNEGRLAFTSHSSPNTYMRIHQDEWTMNSSQLACQYLGFEGVFVTLSGAQYDNLSEDLVTEASVVICPPNTTNITNCWHNETRVDQIEESIAVVCCPVNTCNTSGLPLGLESGSLPDSAFSASTCYSGNLCGQHARLNGPSAWIPNPSNEDQWLQVQFESNYVVTAITTQGKPGVHVQWIRSYTISSSPNNHDWTDYLNVHSGSIEVFAGNYDQDSDVTHVLGKPMVGRFFRIHPKTFHSLMALRLELYGYGPFTHTIELLNHDVKPGCPPIRGEGLGVEDGRIPDSSLTSSSFYDVLHEPTRGRLNTARSSVGVGGWVAASDDPDKWIKADLGNTTSVTGVISQGRADFGDQLVTSLRISYSVDNTNWTFALEDQCGMRKTYAANFDANTHVTILFPRPVTARYVRLHPVTYTGFAAMRFEVLGINN